MNKCTLVCAIRTMKISACVWEREEEERNDRKKKNFIDGFGKWNGNNAQNENKKKEIVPDKK